MQPAASIALALPSEETLNHRWFAEHSSVTQLYLGLGYYTRSGRHYAPPYLAWAIATLRAGNGLLALAADLAPDNAAVAARVAVLLDRAETALGSIKKGDLFLDRASQLRALLDAFLIEIARPGQCAFHGGASAPADAAALHARLGFGLDAIRASTALLEPMLRLAGAFPAQQGSLQRVRDLHLVLAMLVRTGALRPPRSTRSTTSKEARWHAAACLLADRIGGDVTERLRLALAASDNGLLARQGELMAALWQAHSQLISQIAVDENLADPDFKGAREHWILTGATMTPALAKPGNSA